MSITPHEASANSLPAESSPSVNAPLRSIHTDNFSAILQELGVSLLVTTYQAGKLVVLRPDGDRLNTHFRGFNKPMGLAVDGDRMAIGTSVEIWEYHNAPAVARQLEPVGSHDACFLPRSSVCTGDIQIHEMAWADASGGESGISTQQEPELWFVNTRFSCLCTRSNIHSFVPRWKPPFISALAPEDRCHLNGLCVVDGRPAFVTALGTTDTPGGWRDNKKCGGVLLEVETGEVVATGLSMPHSPRFYRGRLWVLDSGTGYLGHVDSEQGRFVPLTFCPGYLRGLTFVGDYAVVGLSRPRHDATFGGLALQDELDRRKAGPQCGLHVIDLRSGDVVHWLRLEGEVSELYDVAVLPGVARPMLLGFQTDEIQRMLAVDDEGTL